MDPAGAKATEGRPRVSIVIPVYNTGPYLRECVDSALGQTYPNTEVVAVDDGSTDGSPGILASYGARIRAIRLPHSGISEAHNAGIRAMEGEWFKALGSDDVLKPGAVAALLAAAEEEAARRGIDPSRLVPYADSMTIGEDGSTIAAAEPYPCGPLTAAQQGAMMLDAPFGLPAVSLIHRSALDDVGPYDNRYGIGEDIELNLRLTVRGGYRMLHVPKTLYRYRRRSGQATGSWPAVLGQIRRIEKDWMSSLDADTRAAYAADLGRFRRAKLFLYGVWTYANRGRNAAGGAAPGGGTSAGGGGAAAAVGRHWLPRVAYHSARARSTACLAGWLYAARNPGSELVARCRGRPINSCTSIVRLGFGPRGESAGEADASSLPRLIVPWAGGGGGEGHA